MCINDLQHEYKKIMLNLRMKITLCQFEAQTFLFNFFDENIFYFHQTMHKTFKNHQER